MKKTKEQKGITLVALIITIIILLILAGISIANLTQTGLFEKAQEAKEKRLLEMLSLVDKAEHILTDKHTDLDDFGRLLDHTWKLKRQTGSAVSTNSIDELYEKGMQAGALGGKLLGAGGGGFLVFYVQPEYQKAVKEAMKDLMYIPFKFEDGGTRVIHYTPETYVPLEGK